MYYTPAAETEGEDHITDDDDNNNNVNRVRLRLWTAAVNGPIVHSPGDICEQRTTVEW
jgi:hypothetical protein